MKEYKYLYQAMLSEKTIRKAYKNLRKGKTRRAEVKYIDAHLDDEVQKMHDMILNTKPDGIEVQNPKLGFKPHKHTQKIIYEHGKIRKMLGRRFRLKLKKNRQVCKFFYQGKRKAMGRPLDFMGFVFYRDKTIIRKRIMLKATQTARHLHKAKEAGRSYCRHNIAAMLSYMGWFSCTDTYECFKRRIKPNVKIGKLKEIISKLDRRKKNHETLGTRSMLQSA